MDRRDFLKILGITSSATLISSCGVDKANEKIIPYVIPPEEKVYPGKALYFSTTCSECPAHCGLQVTVKEKVYHDIRGLFPTKLEGIAGHPINDGALCARGQAGLFRLYHPQRIKRPLLKDDSGNFRILTWKEALERITQELQIAASAGLTNIFFASRTTGTLSDLIDEFCGKQKVKRTREFEIFSYSTIREANRLVFNQPRIPAYHIDRADVLLTLGADIFETFISPVQFAAQYARVREDSHFRWFHVEPHLSLTGVQATQRLVLKAESEWILLSHLIAKLSQHLPAKRNLPAGILQVLPHFEKEYTSQHTGISPDHLQELVDRLASAEKPLIIAGGVSTAHAHGLEVAVLASLLQWMLGNDNNQVDFAGAENYQQVGSMLDVEEVVKQLAQNSLGVFFISRANPVAQLPRSFEFSQKLKNARFTVGLSDVMNETMRECQLILPLSHPLESWGDAVPHYGLRTALQPAIDPQFDSRSEGDILLSLMNGEESTSRYKDYLFERWNKNFGEEGRKEFLTHGYRQESVSKVQLTINTAQTISFLKEMDLNLSNSETVLWLTPSIRNFDGRGADLSLLQEIPDPLTTITYGDWISISPQMASALTLSDRDEIQIATPEFSLHLPVKVQKLLPAETLVLQRGQSASIPVQIDRRSGELHWVISNPVISRTGRKIALPILAGSVEEEGRGILPAEEEHGHTIPHKPWYPEHAHKNYRWGMVIDLESCIGCNACVAACYVENNIPLVGAEEHGRGREMSWLRIQPYFDKDGHIEFVPMLCQHCDNAPCETVCPVYAAYHNQEGLNVQVYNRCVGTRYCANNCPYKVRRFNWFDHHLPEPLDKMYNPDLSVRGRGIMEKCTFCIQRIRAAKDLAKDEGRLVQDGEIVPACAQTCPTKAITFGNLEDTKSKVYQLAQSERAYHVLEELGTKPAVNYLRKRGNHHEA